MLNDDVLEVLTTLNNHGYKAYAVGGAIRDEILGLTPSDFDIVSDIAFDEFQKLFAVYKTKVYANGKCISLKYNETKIEMSNLKANDILTDLSLRDYSINSIAYGIDEGLIDPYNGEADVKNGILRTVLDPKDVFKSDPLRILRGIRFEITRGMAPSIELVNAMNENAYLLKDVKTERIANEINPIFTSYTPSEYIRKYRIVIEVLFPAFKECYRYDQKSKWHHLTVDEHILSVMDHVKPDLVTRLAAFFHDIKKPEATITDKHGINHFPNHYVLGAEYLKEELTKYHYSSDIIKDAYNIVLFHDCHLVLDDVKLKEFLYKFGTRNLDKFFDLQKADIYSQNPELLYRLDEMDKVIKRCYELVPII